MKEKRSDWWKATAGLAVLALLAVGLGLLFRGQGQTPAATGPTATVTAQPAVTQEVAATPTTMIVPTGTAPTSPTVVTPTETTQPEPTSPIPGLDDYLFGEPQVVLTNPHRYIGIAGWLPDSEHLLITRGDPERPLREFIETFNVRTGDVRRLGERNSLSVKPLWLAATQEVAYTDWVGKEYRALYISRGETAERQTIATTLSSLHIGADPKGQQIVFFAEAAGERPQLWDVQQETVQTLPFTLAPLAYTTGPMMPSPYRIAWHPSEDKVAFYNNYHFFVMNLDTDQVQEIELSTDDYGQVLWAMNAQWSPNGRYIAMVTTSGDLPVESSELTILDAVSGELRSMHPGQSIYPGQDYVTDMAWAPDSYHLAVLAVVRRDEIGVEYDGLYLTGVDNTEFQRLAPEHEFGGAWGEELAWSPDGLHLAVLCPTSEESRLCILPISQEGPKGGQP